MTFGILGSGSWATALAKILTDNNNTIQWWIRNSDTIDHLLKCHNNPHYLSSVMFNTSLLNPSISAKEVIQNSDCIIIAVPSAFADAALHSLDKDIFRNKKIVSAIKGILPGQNLLLNDYLKMEFNVELKNYFAVLGPCHAEEIASEKLSYLTFSGIDKNTTSDIASCFKNRYLNTV